MEGEDSLAEDRWDAIRATYGEEMFNKVRATRLLVIGAGGIGCELLKNLVLTGFQDIEVVDLDTIDVSNLNRQFLFQKQHVGHSKAHVAREAVLQYNPDAKIVAHHSNVMTPEFGPAFVGQFSMVLNALDNLPARRHVNRVCLSAGVPLIDSGTQGWLGQVQPFFPPHTACFDCEEKPTPTTFPVCTIRSKPSKPIHCIHWAKLLFSRLFGKADPNGAPLDLDKDEEVAEGNADADKESEIPKTVDAELQKVLEQEVSLLNKLRARETFPHYVFHKLYHTDTLQLVSMKDMWQDRAPPIPLDYEKVKEDGIPSAENLADQPENTQGLLEDQRVWSTKQCLHKFSHAVRELTIMKNQRGGLDWDKDEELHLDFVTAAANLRCSQFSIPRQSRFMVKSAAGNIIPAIATTNAIIAGLIVTEAIKILRSGNYEDLKYTYLQKTPSNKRILLVAYPEPKKPSCFVCGSNFVQVHVDVEATPLGIFATEVLEKKLNITVPSVMIDSNIVFEGGDMLEDFEHQVPKKLNQVGITDGTIIRVSDMNSGSSFSVDISIVHKPRNTFKDVKLEETPYPFHVIGSTNKPSDKTIEPIAEPAAAPTDDDDDFIIVSAPSAPEQKNLSVGETPEPPSSIESKKRKRSEDTDHLASAAADAPSSPTDGAVEPPTKRVKLADDSDVMVIDD